MTTSFEAIGVTFHMWFLSPSYAIEKIPMEITALGTVCCLLLFFHFFPIANASGRDLCRQAKF